MIRAVLAVVLAVALVSIASPALQDARYERTAAGVADTATRLDRAATLLATEADPPVAGVAGARRVITVRVPAGSITSVPITRLTIDGTDPPGAGGVVIAELSGHRSISRPISTDLRTPNGAIVLGTAGAHDLRLTLIARGGLAVLVTRG